MRSCAFNGRLSLGLHSKWEKRKNSGWKTNDEKHIEFWLESFSENLRIAMRKAVYQKKIPGLGKPRRGLL